MKKVPWTTTTGILGILFGILGLLASVSNIVEPVVRQQIQEQFALASSRIQEQGEQAGTVQPLLVQWAESMRLPEWFVVWETSRGLIGIVVSVAYILGCILILQVKASGIRLFYVAVCFSILLNVLQLVFAFATSSLWLASTLSQAIVGIVLDVILLIAVVIGNKDVFQDNLSRMGKAA